MAKNRLPNYLRAHRKRLGLSQAEVAFLLGAEGGAKMCRYEKFSRIPTLETALACEVIFKKPASELFAGLYQQVGRKVSKRAARQIKQFSQTEGSQISRKQQWLVELAESIRKKIK